jgi:hypothetical protein
MNRIIGPRLSILADVLFLPVILMGCGNNCDLCMLPCTLCVLLPPYYNAICLFWCFDAHCPNCPNPFGTTDCADNPDGCVATFEQMELTASQFCEQYPEECQQAFDAWVESFDEEDLQ